jgi:hypothetical protein
MSTIARTLEEHDQFLEDIVRLQLWFLWTWRHQHPDETFETAIRTRVDIFRKTDLNVEQSKNTRTAGDFSLAAWQDAERAAARICAASASADAFEAQAWAEVFKPLVQARVERDFAEGNGLENFNCGSLRYDVRPPQRQDTVFFHIGNTLSPTSIFSDPAYLPGCFRQLLAAVTERYQATRICTGSWLNSYERWLALFPQEWRDSLGAPVELGWSQGHWGQFISARGTLNHRHAAMLRATGELPFATRRASCSIAAMAAHLDALGFY